MAQRPPNSTPTATTAERDRGAARTVGAAPPASTGSRHDPSVPVRDDPTAVLALLDQQRETIRQLRAAVETRDLIGQAKGILMERHRITADAAFALLQSQSSRRNSRLVDVAEQLIDPGPAERAEACPQRTRR